MLTAYSKRESFTSIGPVIQFLSKVQEFERQKQHARKGAEIEIKEQRDQNRRKKESELTL